MEDGSVRSDGSWLVHAGVAWHYRRAEFALDLFNVLDSRDDDIAYHYASRLAGEPAGGVLDTHFHPLEPRTMRARSTDSPICSAVSDPTRQMREKVYAPVIDTVVMPVSASWRTFTSSRSSRGNRPSTKSPTRSSIAAFPAPPAAPSSGPAADTAAQRAADLLPLRLAPSVVRQQGAEGREQAEHQRGADQHAAALAGPPRCARRAQPDRALVPFAAVVQAGNP